MRPILLWTSSVLVALGIAGVALTASGQADALWARLAIAWPVSPATVTPHQVAASSTNASPDTNHVTVANQDAEAAQDLLPIPDSYREIDGMRIPSIDLSSEVVPAQLVD